MSRCKTRAPAGRRAISSRLVSHTGRGYTSRQPSGWRVSVSCPLHWAASASRCRVGTVSRPLASNERALLPWNKMESPLSHTLSYFLPLYGKRMTRSSGGSEFFQSQQALSAVPEGPAKQKPFANQGIGATSKRTSQECALIEGSVRRVYRPDSVRR